MIFVVTLGDMISLAITGLALIGVLALWLPGVIKQSRCKHDGSVGETRACEAICAKCGKNLGFIGTWREKHPT